MYYIHKKLDMNLYKLYSYYVQASPKNHPKTKGITIPMLFTILSHNNYMPLPKKDLISNWTKEKQMVNCFS